jgi:hypothetical protein
VELPLARIPNPISPDEALRGRPSTKEQSTMLAEIFLIQTEAILRASTESESADNSRFVPITLVDKEGLLDRPVRRAPERAIAESW